MSENRKEHQQEGQTKEQQRTRIEAEMEHDAVHTRESEIEKTTEQSYGYGY